MMTEPRATPDNGVADTPEFRPTRPGRTRPLVLFPCALLERQDLTTDARDEAITSSGNVHDVALTALAITQGAPQLGDVEAQAALLDRDVGPRSGHELALADDFAGAADQNAEQVECTAAQRN